MVRRMGRWAAAVALFCSLGCASVRPLQESVAYKAVRLNADSLEETIQDKGIKTVVHLSGFQPDDETYRAQREVCDKLQVQFVDVQLDPYGPHREEVIRLLEAYHGCPKPILICANRTRENLGFAAALYRLTELNEDKEKARDELPFWMWRRSPIARFQYHDRFLYEWRDESQFYATYQLPEPDFKEVPARRIAELGAVAPVPAVRLGQPF